jgi:hypothetical protein
MTQALSSLVTIVISGLTFMLCAWAASLWHRNKGLNDEIKRLKEQKWQKDIDDIRARYDNASVQSVVDQSNKDWAARKNTAND